MIADLLYVYKQAFDKEPCEASLFWQIMLKQAKVSACWILLMGVAQTRRVTELFVENKFPSYVGQGHSRMRALVEA